VVVNAGASVLGVVVVLCFVGQKGTPNLVFPSYDVK
jgi:hypothetical protein